jgi:hypothetical protein
LHYHSSTLLRRTIKSFLILKIISEKFVVLFCSTQECFRNTKLCLIFLRINIAFLRITELKSVTKAEKFANCFTSNIDETFFIIFHCTWEKCFISLGSQQFSIHRKNRHQTLFQSQQSRDLLRSVCSPPCL